MEPVAAPGPRVPDPADALQGPAAERRLCGQSLAGEERVREGEADARLGRERGRDLGARLLEAVGA